MTPTDPAALVRRIKLAMATANEGVLLELLEAAAAALSALVGEKECILQVIRDMRDGFTDPTSGEPRVGFEQKWRVAHEILVEVRAKLAKVGQFNEVSRVYTDDSPERLGEVCAHGSLKRQCRVCELEADVARLAQENERLTRALREAGEVIHSEFCQSTKCLPPCLDVQVALGAAAQEGR